jgi:hypothetical protein
VKQYYSTSTTHLNNSRRVVGKRQGEPHAIQFIEGTKLEFYKSFKAAHPDIKISQTMFERLAPFWVRVMGPAQRITCSCQHHTDMAEQYKCFVQFFDKLVSATLLALSVNLTVAF